MHRHAVAVKARQAAAAGRQAGKSSVINSPGNKARNQIASEAIVELSHGKGGLGWS